MHFKRHILAPIVISTTNLFLSIEKFWKAFLLLRVAPWYYKILSFSLAKDLYCFNLSNNYCPLVLIQRPQKPAALQYCHQLWWAPFAHIGWRCSILQFLTMFINKLVVSGLLHGCDIMLLSAFIDCDLFLAQLCGHTV